MSFQYFSGQVRGLRGPGLTAEQADDVAIAVAIGPTVEDHENRLDAVEAALPGKATAAQGAKADTAVQPDALAAAIGTR
ncbi:hypothetical protein, partial [Sphingobium yanoikuyae]|uniref:hypothetical protein n=1 Tax=Sphingobium yanoikuyae TaxID=13690 RepID=UPI0028B17DA0